MFQLLLLQSKENHRRFEYDVSDVVCTNAGSLGRPKVVVLREARIRHARLAIKLCGAAGPFLG
jgi:hypothetical protein